MRGFGWIDTVFRFTFLPTLMLFAGRELFRNIRLLWKEMLEGGGFRW